MIGNQGSWDAVIADLDGVVTRTARVHERAWKRVFDEYLALRARRDREQHPPFTEQDYRHYVDGKPRYDGVRSFLASRGVTLDEGAPSDPPDRESVCGLGNRKDRLFHEFLRSGVEVFDDAVEQLQAWRARGVPLAVVSSSKNCREVLEAAGLAGLFDVRVDGATAVELGLPGKPAPDTFLEAARRLGVAPARAVVLEDAEAGVRAGRRGGFGRVVGVDRNGHARALAEAGAHVVVKDLRHLEPGGIVVTPVEIRAPLPALDHMDAIARAGSRLAVFLDYDGTLTPIVDDPARADLAEDMRDAIRNLVQCCPVAVVSGRDRPDVARRVGLDSLYYAGSHGFDIAGPDRHMQHQAAGRALAALDAAEQALGERLAPIAGALVERKRFSVAAHYRMVARDQRPHLMRHVDEVLAAHEALRKRHGKKVVELQPDVDWDKGHAVRWLLRALELEGPEVVPIYIGDDLTDEDAFRAVEGPGKRGIGIIVGTPGWVTRASYRLADPAEVGQFLRALARLCAPARSA